jgi:hypothetical protein
MMKTKLTRTGCIVPSSPEVKKELTVRPIKQGDYGGLPPSFKVFKETPGGLCVPRFYGAQKFGPPETDARPEPARANINFVGTLRDETRQNEAFDMMIKHGHLVTALDCGYVRFWMGGMTPLLKQLFRSQVREDNHRPGCGRALQAENDDRGSQRVPRSAVA